MNPRHTPRYGFTNGRSIQPPHGWRTLAEGEPIPPLSREYIRGLGWSDEMVRGYDDGRLASMTTVVLSIAVPVDPV
jgi:hypothetical protein